MDIVFAAVAVLVLEVGYVPELQRWRPSVQVFEAGSGQCDDPSWKIYTSCSCEDLSNASDVVP